MRYSEEVIEDLCSRADIAEVIGQYVPLKKMGSRYFGLCPFHGEKTPSFSVTPSKGMFYCFGCGKGGNVLKFIMEYENLTFPEAIRMLADSIGYKLPEGQEEDSKARAERDIREQLLKINKQAALYYYHTLRSKEGQKGLQYFKERELKDETIRHFGLGFSGPGGDRLYSYFRKLGYYDDILRETGLFSFSERGVRDKFFKRVMFPIMDQNSRVIGFGGRVIGDGMPKYLNSPETMLFEKSKNLFGMNFARKSGKKYFILCEGYMDVISMHQAGFDSAIASLGTSFTEEQARLLKRFSNEILLCYDSDNAGIKASRRAIPILRNEGITPKILSMSPYKDPDEFMKSEGKEALEERIKHARNAFLWEAEVMKASYDLLDPAAKTEYDEALAELVIYSFPERIERENYVKALCREQGISEEDFRHLLLRKAGQYLSDKQKRYNANAKINAKVNNKIYTNNVNTKIIYTNANADLNTNVNTKNNLNLSANTNINTESAITQSERQLITWISDKPELLDKVRKFISPEALSDEVYREVLKKLYEGRTAAKILDSFREDEEKYSKVVRMFNSNLLSSDADPEELKKGISDVIRNILIHSIEEKIRNEQDAGRYNALFSELDRIRNSSFEDSF